MVACRMMKIFETHKPVLLDEAINQLAINPEGTYIDATFGRGGHSQAILNQLGPTGKLFAFDKDPEAILYANNNFAADKRFTIFHASFAELKTNLQNYLGQIDGILFDLGVSSPQLDDPDRGFSFMRAGKLDMRMDTTRGESASEWLSKVSEKRLMEVLWNLGEEKYGRRIARAIIAAREEGPISTTTELAEIIKSVVPKSGEKKHPATRSFQAIRIAINSELEDLTPGLEQAYELLKVGGRLAVISFHSLEDRIVKQFIQYKEKGAGIPARLPVKTVNRSLLKRVGQAIKPSEQEINENPRARSAILRIAEKQL